MKIAYFIMAHHKPENLLRLLNAIYSERNLYLIHIDSKASNDMFTLARQLSGNSNVHFLPSRSTSWGGWSLVQAEIDAMRYLITDPTWTTYINLSGQDFPLVSQENLYEAIDTRLNYLNFLDYETEQRITKLTGQMYYVEDMGKIEILGARPDFRDYFDESIKTYRGSQWKILNRQFIEYVLSSELSLSLQDYYRYTLIPDEGFFQTLIGNSEYATTLERDNRRYIKGFYSEDNVFFGAMDLTTADVQSMMQGNALFARKFDSDKDATVLDILERML